MLKFEQKKVTLAKYLKYNQLQKAKKLYYSIMNNTAFFANKYQ